MPRALAIETLAALAALLAPALAAAQEAIESLDAGVEAASADAGIAEPELDAPFLPGAEIAEEPASPGDVPYDDAAAPEEARAEAEDLPDGKPYAKGDMEPGLGLGFAGYDAAYYMIIGGSFAYYVANRFAPGIEISYGTDFGSADIPDDVTLLPFAKFVILRSYKFAPYLIAQVGREFEFAGENAVHSWILGMGAGAHIGLGSHFLLKIEVTFQHHWYDDKRIRKYDDGGLCTDGAGNEYAPPSEVTCDDLATWDPDIAETTGGDPCLCQSTDLESCVCAVDDKKDVTREWIYPIVTLGAAFVF